MKFGYLLVISKNKKVDYLRLAYALALSIKITQKPGYDKIALVTDDTESVKLLRSPWVFDRVIEWKEKEFWDGRSWMDELTPWKNTVCLDADMLFFRDYSHWIDYFLKSDTELFLPSTVYTYRGNIVTDDYYRKAFVLNDLPNLYSMFTYFKSESDLCRVFFELNRKIVSYQEEYKNLYLQKHIPKIIGTDESFALSSRILGIQDVITYRLEFPKIVHLKSMIQGWPWPADTVSDHVGFYFDLMGQLKIGNFQQQNIVHYNEKTFITEEIISILENIIWKR